MRLLWVGHFAPWPPRGGAPQRSYNLLREAAGAAEVHFVGASMRGHQPRPEDVDAAREALAAICAGAELVPLRFRSSRAGKLIAAAEALTRSRSYNQSWVDVGRLRRAVAAAVERTRPDVIHVDSVMIADLLPASAGAAVLNHHNIESHMIERRSERCSGLMRWFTQREARRLAEFERLTAPRFRRHLVVSDLDAERFVGLAPQARCEVVPNGVDPDFFRPLDVEERPHELVFAGRMNWYPNEHAMTAFLDELWPRLTRSIADLRLVVAGMNPTRNLRARAGADPRVQITGFVEDIRPVIAAAGIYVCPILDGGGTRLKILDAMALGKAIVATPLAVEGIGLRDGEHAVVRPFGTEFVEAVLSLADDAEARRRLAGNAREWVVENYGWPAIGRRLLQAYRAAAEVRS